MGMSDSLREHMESMDKSIDRTQTDIQNVWQCVDHNAIDTRRLIEAMSSRVDLIKYNQDKMREETYQAVAALQEANNLLHKMLQIRKEEIKELEFKFTTAKESKE